MTPTIDGNVLVGPTIENIGGRIDYDATQDMINVLGSNGNKLFFCGIGRSPLLVKHHHNRACDISRADNRINNRRLKLAVHNRLNSDLRFCRK